MREGIFPCWDDPANIRGGCVSIRIETAVAASKWDEIARRVLADAIMAEAHDARVLNGVSIAPKRGCAIIKLWMRDSDVNWTKRDFRLPVDGEVLFRRNLDSIHIAHGGSNVSH
jgi:hypothetical protein